MESDRAAGRRMRLGVAAVLFALVGTTIWGCATTGRKGNVTFSYVADDQIENGVRESMVAGTDLQVVVRPATKSGASDGTPEPLRIERAWSSSRRVFRVLAPTGRSQKGDVTSARLTVRAVQPGRADLHVETNRGDDVVELEVQRLDRVEIVYWFEPWPGTRFAPDEVVLLREGAATFYLAKFGPDGDRLIGRGIERYVEFGSGSKARIEAGRQSTALFRIKVSGGSSLQWSVGVEGGNSERQTRRFDVVGADRVQSLNLVPPNFCGESEIGPSPPLEIVLGAPLVCRTGAAPRHDILEVGGGTFLLAVATVVDGRRAIGLEGPLDVTSQTPKVCRVEPFPSPKAALGDGAFAIRGEQPGDCRIEARLGKTQAQYQFTVVPDSDSGEDSAR